MTQVTWLTPQGSLGTFAEEEYCQLQLDAYDGSGHNVTYTLIAGVLSDGLQLTPAGVILGIPVVPNPTSASEYTQTFTIRATGRSGGIADRTFAITINAIAAPQIIPKNLNLGAFYTGSYINIQLTAIDYSPELSLTWSQLSGTIPAGLTLSSSGLLSGYLLPPVNKYNVSLTGWDVGGWGYIPWDSPSTVSDFMIYQFEMQVTDGSRFDQSTYIFTTYIKSSFTADNAILTADNTNITTDVNQVTVPIVTTLAQSLPPIRQNSFFSFKFTGLDLDNRPIYFAMDPIGQTYFAPGLPTPADFVTEPFSQTGFTLPAGLTLDSMTGWLTGTVGSQVAVSETYTFQVFCYLAADASVVSPPVKFSLTVLGNLNNVIDWNTPSYLGSIDNGNTSEFSIVATSRLGRPLRFSLTPPLASTANVDPTVTALTYTPVAFSRLPQGLTLLDNGDIAGRVSFEYFKMDTDETTFDSKTTTFDNTYTFSVTATDATIFELDAGQTTIDNGFTKFDDLFINDPVIHGASVQHSIATVTDTRTFTITVNNYNKQPYQNLYLTSINDTSTRNWFTKILQDQDLFPDSLIYRQYDPNFGKASDIKSLFAVGLTPATISQYALAIANNTVKRRLILNNIKTAVALDENYNVKYEVVYVEVFDPENPNNAIRPASYLDSINHNITIYPDDLQNMYNNIATIGFTNRGALPSWMTSRQPDGSVVGFKQVVVLAYTLPGASALITYRLSYRNIQFNNVNFLVDRYQLDDTLTTNYDTTTQTFTAAAETTFDRNISFLNSSAVSIGAVDYALSIPFDQINCRSVDYINQYGGLDGVTNWTAGQTLIFAVQEQYTSSLTQIITQDVYDQNGFDTIGFNQTSITPPQYSTDNDGWNNTAPSLFGSFIFGDSAYSGYTPVPGYADQIATGVVNQRAGIWQITIDSDNIVTLVFMSAVQANNYVFVKSGATYANDRLYLDPVVPIGKTVPAYMRLTTTHLTQQNSTMFDMGATRFFTGSYTYSMPDANNQWIKLPDPAI